MLPVYMLGSLFPHCPAANSCHIYWASVFSHSYKGTAKVPWRRQVVRLGFTRQNETSAQQQLLCVNAHCPCTQAYPWPASLVKP